MGVVSAVAANGTRGFANGFAIMEKIRKITPSRIVSTLAESGSSGKAHVLGVAVRFKYPTGITIDLAVNLYVAELFNQVI